MKGKNLLLNATLASLMILINSGNVLAATRVQFARGSYCGSYSGKFSGGKEFVL